MKQEMKQEPRNEHLSGHSGNGNGQMQNGSSRREHKGENYSKLMNDENYLRNIRRYLG